MPAEIVFDALCEKRDKLADDLTRQLKELPELREKLSASETKAKHLEIQLKDIYEHLKTTFPAKCGKPPFAV